MHDEPFIEALLRLESGHPYVTRLDANLVVVNSEVNLGIHPCSNEHVEHFINPRNAKSVINGDLIDSTTVHAHMPRPILLWG